MFFLATASAATESAGGNPEPSEMFQQLFSHVSAHKLFDFCGIEVTNHVVMGWVAAALAFLIFYSVARRASRSDRPRGAFQNAFESLVLYVRDEMVYKVAPKHYADKLMPLFLTFFVFILFCNLLGLVPIPKIGGTATSNIAVTAALSSVTFLMMVVGGMVAVGPGKFWLSLVPQGLPVFMVPFMFIIEVAGLIIKAGALTLRLFANMIAGHLVILSFFGLIYVMESYIVMLPALALAIFITLLEVFVAFLQAFVFTFLSIIFVSAAIHPEH
jgi:F-type H+-transporting ATPase subunit a